MSRLTAKKILVTAAGQGIGRAIALACAREGAEVTATDVDENLLVDIGTDDMGTERGIATQRLDVTSKSEIAELARELGAVDGIANVAGMVHNGTALDATDDELTAAFELNVRPMHRIARAFLPAMLENGGGSLVNIASVASSVKGVPMRFAYGTTKAAVIGLTKSIAADFVSRGIRANAICPGTVESPSLDARIDAFDDPEAARRNFIARQPMGRLGKAEEIAALALHLLADESAYTTGTAIVIDGGMTL